MAHLSPPVSENKGGNMYKNTIIYTLITFVVIASVPQAGSQTPTHEDVELEALRSTFNGLDSLEQMVYTYNSVCWMYSRASQPNIH